ncbi:hypothetical protein, variant 1 [Phialophora macrospora]|uniref:Transcription factor domain-containing protein n=1 Tax=Phialophora macrospora TaxID=1851006 RepID=A0A0D2FVU7_9EURO|nr:hypothetical protein, variant 1 [Phialophora macrospora]
MEHHAKCSSGDEQSFQLRPREIPFSCHGNRHQSFRLFPHSRRYKALERIPERASRCINPSVACICPGYQPECGHEDEMLMTIALLAIHGSVQPLKRPRFTAPLYRDNEFYSNVKFDQTHLRALRTLVGQRGGLVQLELHGLSNIISMIDTFQSLMCLSRPQFESLYSMSALSESMQETWDDVTWTRFTNQKDGFQFLDDYEDGFRLRRIICQTRVLVETYWLCLRDPRKAPDFMVAVHTRRSLQHAALRIDHPTECLFEAARLATIIFLAELGWTLPVVGGFQDKATELLFRVLEECGLQQYWQTHSDFLVWATVMGGLAAHQTDRLRDFAKVLRDSSTPVTKDSWLHVKSLSLQFLPFEFDLTGHCHAFWNEACELLSNEPLTRAAPDETAMP